MSVGLDELKKKYNEVLAREKNAEKYISNCTEEEFEKWSPEFNKIVGQLGLMMKQYREFTGIEMTKEEILNGFQLN